MSVEWHKLGEYIEVSTKHNADIKYGTELIEGVNSVGEFCKPKACLDGIDLKPYKIVRPGDFVYNPSRINIGSLAYRKNPMCIVSHLYVVFHLTKYGKTKLIAEYLFLYLQRDEFRRLVTYRNFGSQRPEFNFRQMCEVEIPVPRIAEQRKVVEAWQGLRKMKEENEQLAEPLLALCRSYLQEIKKKYPMKEIGPMIERVDVRNADNSIHVVKSVSVTKEFKDTNAKVDKSQLQSYKIVKPGEVSFVQTTGNEKCLCIAVSHFDDPIVVTSVNEVFKVDEGRLLADFLYLWWCRKESDRYARFHSWGSARETFNWADMCRVKIPLPPIEVQQAVVDLYRCANEAKKIAAEADKLSREICPALIQRVVREVA